MKISEKLLEQIGAHAKRSYPEESCGILLGKVNGGEKVVSDIVEIENAREEQRGRRFLITPEAYRNADMQARERGLEILGFYHSHPDHPARPSQYDLDHAWTWFSYLITSVEQGEPRHTTSWILRGDRSAFDQEEIEEVT